MLIALHATFFLGYNSFTESRIAMLCRAFAESIEVKQRLFVFVCAFWKDLLFFVETYCELVQLSCLLRKLNARIDACRQQGANMTDPLLDNMTSNPREDYRNSYIPVPLLIRC